MNILNYLWVILSLNMGEKEFQNFIGKHIKEISVINRDKLKHNGDLNKYYLSTKVGYEFYSKTYNNLTVSTNDQDIIKNITIYVNGIIDKTFYAAFINSYGLPTNIMVIDTIKAPCGTRYSGDGQLGSYSMEQATSLKKGNFEDKPVLLIWDKKDYQIRFFLRYDIKISEIKFTLATGKL